MSKLAYVYLLHVPNPIGRMKHYLGYCYRDSVQDRVAKHNSGNGSKNTNNGIKHGITYQLVRTWECKSTSQARSLERQLKLYKNSPRLCPVCNKDFATRFGNFDEIATRFFLIEH